MKKFLLVFLLLISLQAFPQQELTGPENTKVEMADQLRSDGKIYVVVAVMTTVLIGLLAYAVILDRRIGKLERESGDSDLV